MTTIDLRKRPKQARSLARFNTILDEAEVMIAEQGDSDLKMNELARRAEVNIASIYQYFPNRAALLRQLIERYLEKYQAYMVESLGQYEGDTAGLVDLIVDGYQDFFNNAPVFAALWSESQGDPTLKALDIQDSQENARFMAEIAAKYLPHLPSERLENLCFLCCDLSGGLMQTVLSMPKETADALVDEYKNMLKIYVATL